MTRAYAVITPAHNEAASIARIGACMAGQTVLPTRWVLVENGSSDGTYELALGLAEKYPWVQVVQTTSLASEERGAPIVHAIHAGLSALEPWPEVVAQLDADLSLPPDYFERLLVALEHDETLGIVSGTCFEEQDGVWRERFATGANVWGAARVYRRDCLEQVLPLEQRTGWDSVDVAEANARGWNTRVLRDIRFDHHRPEASREQSRWTAWAAQGRVSHYIGYRPTYLLLRAAFRAPRDPTALGLVTGYAGEVVRRRPRCAKPGVCAFVRREQRLRELARRLAEARGGGRPSR